MLALVARQQSALRLLLPAASQAAYGLLLQQERGLKILEVRGICADHWVGCRDWGGRRQRVVAGGGSRHRLC